MDQELPPFFREKFIPAESYSFLNRRWIIAGASVVCGCALLAFYLQSGPKAASFAHAERSFAKWAKAPQNEALFAEMAEALRNVPQLQEKYEAVFVQKCIESGKVNDALVSAGRSLALAREETPFHASYAETSLLIEQGNYQKALERAVSLKERISQAFDVSEFALRPLKGCAVLYAHNLLRIAFLQQELQNRPGEMASWGELEVLGGSPLLHSVFESFAQKGVDLSRYIAERKAVLSASAP